MKNNLKIWFTLAELMTVIAIIAIVTFWVSQMNFNKTSDTQKLEIYNNNLLTNLEYIRNNALTWKSFLTWWSLVIPPSYKIDFASWWDWSVNLFYSWSSWQAMPEYSVNIQSPYSLEAMNCLSVNWTLLDTLSWSLNQTSTIIIEGSNMKLLWDCSDASSRVMEVVTRYNSATWSVLINTVSWLIVDR